LDKKDEASQSRFHLSSEVCWSPQLTHGQMLAEKGNASEDSEAFLTETMLFLSTMS
jgi:hypothetical protein